MTNTTGATRSDRARIGWATGIAGIAVALPVAAGLITGGLTRTSSGQNTLRALWTEPHTLTVGVSNPSATLSAAPAPPAGPTTEPFGQPQPSDSHLATLEPVTAPQAPAAPRLTGAEVDDQQVHHPNHNTASTFDAPTASPAPHVHPAPISPAAPDVWRPPPAAAQAPAPAPAPAQHHQAGLTDPKPNAPVQPRVGRYVALGDSLPAGLDPFTFTHAPHLAYPQLLANSAANAAGVDRLELVNLACSGESVVTFERGGLCRYPQGSQFNTAAATLRAAGPPVVLVTIQLGANHLWPCAAAGFQRQCVASGQLTMDAYPHIIQSLKHLAPQATFLILDYYPAAAVNATGPAPADIADQMHRDAAAINQRIAHAANVTGATWVPVSRGFAVPGEGPVTPGEHHTLCAWTALCQRNDPHPNHAGQAAIAEWALAALHTKHPM